MTIGVMLEHRLTYEDFGWGQKGSRVNIELQGEQWRCHRPHPGKEAKRHQVEEARELLERVGVKP